MGQVKELSEARARRLLEMIKLPAKPYNEKRNKILRRIALEHPELPLEFPHLPWPRSSRA
jgi:hypothetical protein